MSRQSYHRLIASNKKARHDYTILKTYESGIALLDTEVRSARAGRVSIVDAFAQEHDGAILLHGLHIDGGRQAPVCPAGRPAVQGHAIA